MIKNYLKKSILTIATITTSITSYSQWCEPTLIKDSAEILFDGAVNKMEIQDNYLYVGGAFRTVGKYCGSAAQVDKNNGNTINRTQWSKIKGVSYGCIPDGSGNLIVFGDFKKIGDSTRNRLGIIDASGKVTTFKVNVDSTIKCALIYNGVLYIGGYFTKVNNIARNRLAAINLATGALTSWNPNVVNSGPLACRVECMELYNGAIYVGGAFSQIGATTRRNIAGLDAVTGLVNNWAPQAYFMSAPNYGTVVKMHRVNNMMYVCGQFDYAGGNNHPDVAAIDLTTGTASSWAPNPNSIVLALASKGDTLYIGGAFSQTSGQPRQGFAAYSVTTGNLLPITINTNKQLSEQVYSILPVNDVLYIGGLFDTINGSFRKNFASFNRLSGAVLPWTSHANAEVLDIHEDNGRLYAAGKFFSIGRKERSYLAALDMFADTITPWKPRIDGEVKGLSVKNGKIYIGGSFKKVNDSMRNYNAAIALGSAKTLAWNPKADGAITDMVFHNNDIYVSGEFKNIDGQARYGLAKLDTAAGLQTWTGINNSSSIVNAIELYDDKLYVGGKFNNLGGQPRTSLGAIDLATGLATTWNPANNDEVYALNVAGNTLFTSALYFTLPPNSPGGSATWLNVANAYTLPNHINKLLYLVSGPARDMIVRGDELFTAGEFQSLEVSADPLPGTKTLSYKTGCITTIRSLDTIAIRPFNPLLEGVSNTNRVYGNKLYYGGLFNSIETGYDNAALFYLPYIVADATIATDSSSLCMGVRTTVRATSTVTHGVSYNWYVNGIKLNSSLPYISFAPVNKDSIKCVVTVASNGCLAAFSDTTNTIAYNVMPVITPEISISSLVKKIKANNQVTVKAIVKDAATGYSIEWFNKGMSMGKTMVDSINYNKGAGTDSIYAVITPRTDTCYVTDTSGLVIVEEEEEVSVQNINGGVGISVYPNPFENYITVNGLNEGDVLILYDVTGRKLQQVTANQNKYQLQAQELKTGSYVIKITDKQGLSRKNLLIQRR